MKTIECPRCRDARPEGLADCPRCADREAARLFLKHVPEGKLRDRLDAAVMILADTLLADALERAGGNQHAAARALDHRQAGVHELMGKLPHLRRAFPPKPGLPEGATAGRVRDEKGRLHGRAPVVAPTPAASTAAPPPKRKPRAK